MKKNTKKQTLLKGEGANQHTLYGDFATEEKETAFAEVEVNKNSVLRHEQPNGAFGEHFALPVEHGDWVMGKQVEFNPFTQAVSQIWD